MSQLALFTPEPAPLKPTPSYGVPPSVRRKYERAATPEVRAAFLAVAQARPNEWLSSWAFRAVIDKYDIGCCFGRVLWHLEQQGAIVTRKVYFGKGIDAERPGSPNYQGFGHEYRFVAKN